MYNIHVYILLVTNSFHRYEILRVLVICHFAVNKFHYFALRIVRNDNALKKQPLGLTLL